MAYFAGVEELAFLYMVTQPYLYDIRNTNTGLAFQRLLRNRYGTCRVRTIIIIIIIIMKVNYNYHKKHPRIL